jgi:hypothetical protein
MNDVSEKVFKWNDLSTPPKDVPTTSLFALAQRGYSHVLGNEVAAQVSAWKKTEEGAKATEAEIEAYANEKRQEKLQKILDGTLGVRSAAAPRVSGEEAIRRTVTVEVLKKFLKAHNLKFPTGEDTITVAGKAMDREDLISAMYRKDKAKIDAEVEKRKGLETIDASPDELFAD